MNSSNSLASSVKRQRNQKVKSGTQHYSCGAYSGDPGGTYPWNMHISASSYHPGGVNVAFAGSSFSSAASFRPTLIRAFVAR